MGFLREQMGEEELRHLLEMLSVEAGERGVGGWGLTGRRAHVRHGRFVPGMRTLCCSAAQPASPADLP